MKNAHRQYTYIYITHTHKKDSFKVQKKKRLSTKLVKILEAGTFNKAQPCSMNSHPCADDTQILHTASTFAAPSHLPPRCHQECLWTAPGVCFLRSAPCWLCLWFPHSFHNGWRKHAPRNWLHERTGQRRGVYPATVCCSQLFSSKSLTSIHPTCIQMILCVWMTLTFKEKPVF